LTFTAFRLANENSKKPLGNYIIFLKRRLSLHFIVMLFAGPPGHGKTELANQLGKLIVASEESSIKIQCETLENKWEL
jgi:ATP-dependent Clp protease ATP-binding subunit ClpA